MIEAATDTAPEVSDETGVAAALPPTAERRILVAPTMSADLNTIRIPLVPVACWRAGDVRFSFDSSFVLPAMARELRKLARLLREHPGSPASIFGHADPVGKESYNKRLSGRRALAMHALLVRNHAAWEQLYQHEEENWGLPATEAMLGHLGYIPDPGGTLGAVKAFQVANGLDPDGDAGPLTRAKLFPAYMDAICIDDAGQPFRMEPGEFLGRGADGGGKGDYQGCGEFNPVLLFSTEEYQELSKTGNESERDQENAPNRRVMILLFRPGSRIDTATWPCPRAAEGVEGCYKRFWSDADQRRALTDERREFEHTGNTFACRFYHRLTAHSPCERKGPVPIIFDVYLLDGFGRAIAGARWRLRSGELLLEHGVSDSEGLARVRAEAAAERVELQWTRARATGPFGDNYLYSASYFVRAPEETDDGLLRMLGNLGYTQHPALSDNVSDFQMHVGHRVTGQLSDISDELRKWHGSGNVDLVLGDDEPGIDAEGCEPDGDVDLCGSEPDQAEED